MAEPTSRDDEGVRGTPPVAPVIPLPDGRSELVLGIRFGVVGALSDDCCMTGGGGARGLL